MATRHNWADYVNATETYECSSNHREGDGEVDCYGCGAVIDLDQLLAYEYDHMQQARAPWHRRNVDRLLDLLWHEELRPMAELVCLVEEAQSQ